MKIVIDARMLYWTGVGRYTKAVLDELEQIDTTNEYLVLMRPADMKLWQPARSNFKVIEADINPYTFAEQLKLPQLIKSLAPDLVHFTAPNTPLLYRGKRVVTVHDLTLLDYDTSRGTGLKRMIRRLKQIPFKLVLRNNVISASGLIADTRFVKDQLVTRLHANPSKISVTLLAADPNVAKPEPIKRFDIGSDFLLYVGNFYPYKNVASSINALKLLAVNYPALKLAVVGKPDYFRDVLEAQTKQLGLSDRIVFTGFVTDGELVSLYQQAKCYLYPSFSEGFGLQGLEAMAQSLPVVAANASCLPEVYDDAALYFDPKNPADQAAKIKQVLSDGALRTVMVAAGHARLKDFSWRRMGEQTLAAYQDAVRK